MAIAHVWFFPVAISIYSVFCLLTCASLSVISHSFPARWPYLSDFTRHVPAKNIFGIMTNHTLLMVFIWMYLKHRELVTFFKQENLLNLCKWSAANMLIGFAATLCMQLSVNFAMPKVMYLEIYANRACLILGMLYMWLHCFLSFKVYDEFKWTLFVVRLFIASSATSCAAAMLKLQRIGQFSEFGAIYEWICYFAFCFFLLTDAYEFRFLVFRAPKLVIRGSQSYDELVFAGTTHEEHIHESRERMLAAQYVT